MILSLIILVFLAAWQPVGIQLSPPKLGSANSGSIVNTLSGLCIEPVPGSGASNGTLIQIAPCTGSDQQYWELTNSNQLYNPAYDKCIDTIGSPGTSKGTQLQLYDCENTSSNVAQYWTFTSSGFLENGLSALCIDVPGSSNKTSGSILQIWDCETNNLSTTDQRWSFKPKTNNSFGANQTGINGGVIGGSVSQNGGGSSIVNKNLTVTQTGKIVNFLTNKCLDPVGTNPGSGTQVQINTCSDSADMIWEFTKEGFIRNKSSGYCLDVTGTVGKTDGLPLRLWECETQYKLNDQQWSLADSRYLINNLSGKCLDVPGAWGNTDGLITQLWTCEFDQSANTDQRWELQPEDEDIPIFMDGMSGSTMTQTDCYDTDKDCITDEFEQKIADEFMPFFEFDEEEHNILAKLKPADFNLGAGVVYLYQVSAVDCTLDEDTDINSADVVEGEANFERDLFPFGENGEFENPRSVLFTVLEIFPYDYLPKQNILYDFWNESDVFVHYGDIETIKYCLRDDDRDGNYDISFINFRRHKHSYVIRTTAEHEGNHLKFYASEGKHGTYISQVDCREAINNYQSLYWGEDCAGGRVVHPRTESFYNVGEFFEGQQLTFSDLGIDPSFRTTAQKAGFPYYEEYIWNPNYDITGDRSNYFCGGMDVDRYWDNHDVTTFYNDITCPGGISDRWWLTNDLECLEENTDRVGSDYEIIDDLFIGQPEFCAEACVDDPACAAFTFVPGSGQNKALCYLKNSVPSTTYRSGLYSGLRINCLDEYLR